MGKCQISFQNLLIFILLILIKKLKSNTIPISRVNKTFQTISLLNHYCIIITYNDILFSNSMTNNINSKHTFNNSEIITSKEELEMFSYGRFYTYVNNNISLLLVKHFIYSITDDGNLYCDGEISEIEGYKTSIVAIKYGGSVCYYIIGIVKNFKLLLLMYTFNDYICFRNRQITYLEFGSSNSDYLECQKMISDSLG